MAVALHAAADDGAVEYAEGGEQGGGAVALVIVRHGVAAPRLDRQPRLGAVERLDLAFFVERQHDRVSRRIDIDVIVETWSDRRCWLIEPVSLCLQAAMSFSFASGIASRKVCIGVLPKHQRP